MWPFVSGILSLSMMFLGLAHVVACISALFHYSWILFHHRNEPHFASQFISWWTLSYFHLLASMQNSMIQVWTLCTHVCGICFHYVLGVELLGHMANLEKEMATHSSILAWEISGTEEPSDYSPWGCKESDMTEHACPTQWQLYLWIFEDCFPVAAPFYISTGSV